MNLVVWSVWLDSCTSLMLLFLNINTLKLMLVFRSIKLFSFGKLVVDFIIIIIIIIIIIMFSIGKISMSFIKQFFSNLIRKMFRPSSNKFFFQYGWLLSFLANTFDKNRSLYHLKSDKVGHFKLTKLSKIFSLYFSGSLMNCFVITKINEFTESSIGCCASFFNTRLFTSFLYAYFNHVLKNSVELDNRYVVQYNFNLCNGKLLLLFSC